MYKKFMLALAALAIVSCDPAKKLVSKDKNENREVVATPIEESGEFKVFTINSTQEYIDTFKDIAMSEMHEFGIPASITLAQGILESASGRGELTTRTNNHFGIKCHKDWKGAKVYHDDDAKGECFRKYKHPMTSFRDHSLFLSERNRYFFLFKLPKDDYKGWAKGLRKAGYATDRKYPSKLISIINRYKLYQYDAKVLGKDTKDAHKVVVSKDKHIVAKGDTLYSIARKHKITVDQLRKINGLQANEIYIGQVLFVSPTAPSFN